MNGLGSTSLATCLAIGLVQVARRQTGGATPDFREDFMWQLAFVEQRVTELAQAIPQETYSWRPKPETRSISEVLLHVSVGNLLVANSLGSPLPAGFDLMSYEKKTTNKEEVIEIVRASFAQLRRDATAVPLSRKVDLFGKEATAQRALVTVTMHQHEHLGQTIAYARSVGVTPSWTASEPASRLEKA